MLIALLKPRQANERANGPESSQVSDPAADELDASIKLAAVQVQLDLWALLKIPCYRYYGSWHRYIADLVYVEPSQTALKGDTPCISTYIQC